MAAQKPPTEFFTDGATAEVKEGTELVVPVIEIEERDTQDDLVIAPSQPIHSQDCEHKDDHERESHIFSNEESDAEDSDSSEGSWETSSLIEEAFEQLEGSHVPRSGDQISPDECTKAESKAYRKLLRQVGVEEFIRKTVENDSVSARKLCTAFGLRVPFLEGKPDEAYYRILGFAIQREMQKRVKLEEWNTLDDAVRLLQQARNIIVVTGAGISTSLGIPDFRSKHNGLYARLEHLGLSDPQEVFDIGLFREDPTIFYSVAKDILPETKRFTPTHGFIKMLQDRGQLLVNYTQNIDNIEGYAGIESDRLIQCHGSFATATCQKCGHKINGDEIHDDIKAGKIPRCGACALKSQQIRPVALKRKRSTDHRRNKSRQREDSDSSSEGDLAEDIGIMKPDITFFGENLPDTFHDRLRDTDYTTVDLVIVIGTSLKVAPVGEIPNFVFGQNASIPQIYISRDPCKHIAFDIELLGECDVVIAELCRRAGWRLEHEMAVRSEQNIAVEQSRELWQWSVFVKEDETKVADKKDGSPEL